MKRFMQILVALAAVVLLSIVSSLGVYHYVSQENPDLLTKDTAVNAQAELAFEQVTNPVMLSIDDVIQFRQRTVDQNLCDSIFNSIPEEVLTNIAQVVIGRQHSATKKDIVDEYKRNYRTVYQYIKTPPTATSDRSDDTIKVQSPPDTVIDGKHFKLIKENK